MTTTKLADAIVVCEKLANGPGIYEPFGSSLRLVIDTALRASPAEPIPPPGWKLIQRQPTREMIEAAIRGSTPAMTAIDRAAAGLREAWDAAPAYADGVEE